MELLGVPSASIREEFKEHTDGLSNRLPLPSLEAMRAGTVLSPHGLVRRYLFAGRRIGQPKEWAQKFATFVQRTVDSLWPMEATPLRVLEERATIAEHLDDLAEKQLALQYNATTLRQSIRTQTHELVCDQLRLARMERELEEMQ